MSLNGVITYIVQNGKLVRWLRGGTGGGTVVQAPGVPVAAPVVATSTTLTFAWTPPLLNGGSPVTQYIITLSGGTPTTLDSSARSFTFTGLNPTTSYSATIQAVNAIDVGPALTEAATTLTQAAAAARFPGDTRPLVTKTILLGDNEYDHDPTVVGTAISTKTGQRYEYYAPEAVAGIPVSSMRFYYTSWADFDTGGRARSEAATSLSKGRIPWMSLNPTNYAAVYSGVNDAIASGLIAWAETTATGPVMMTIDHESDASTKVPDKGTFADWLTMQRWFRGLMTKYANAHGGANYKWKNLSFGPIFTAQGYATGRVDSFIPNQAADRATFDWVGVDPYVLTTTMAGVTPNFVAAVAWAKRGGWPLGVGEYAAMNSDPQGAAKIQAMYDYCTDGTHDVFMMNYYNSGNDNINWPIQDVAANGFMGRQFVSMMKNPKTVHFWDLTAPDGTKYTRPAGV